MISDDRGFDCEECMNSCKILGIPPRTTEDRAKEAYRDLVRVWHPDRFDGNERLRRKADDQLKEINRAYAHNAQEVPPQPVEEIFHGVSRNGWELVRGYLGAGEESGVPKNVRES